MNDLMIDNEIKVEDMIYEIRGKQVMIDFDLAKLYKCKNGTKTINLAVKRNINRFPNDFYFQLTTEEFSNLRFQTETTKNMTRTLPYAFTEQGVAMLASVLHTNIAIEMSVKIMRAFVKMKKYISSSLIEQKYINNLVLEDHNKIINLEKTFDKLSEKEKVNTIFYENQIYDAYSVLMVILNKAEEEIIIIDNYAGKELLDILKNINKKIIIISKNIDEVLISKYKKQYSNAEFKINNSFHDRFIIIDRVTLYYSGSSFKDLGKKCFAINKIEDSNVIESLLYKI